MAITFQSSQTATFAGNSLTITKPTSTAVGDLLVATISSQSAMTSVPSGWTLITSKASLNNYAITYTYYVLATSTQTAATNFTWGSTSTTVMAGGISRISGEFYSTPVDVFASGSQSDASSSLNYAITVTPNNANSILMFTISQGSNAASATASVSSYAITTSNPSWTEAYEGHVTFSSTASVHNSMAYATRTQITATGNATATTNSGSQSSSIMLVIRPKVSFEFSETITTAETRMKTVNKLFSDSVSLVETISQKLGRLWTTVTKPVTTWINKIKP